MRARTAPWTWAWALLSALGCDGVDREDGGGGFGSGGEGEGEGEGEDDGGGRSRGDAEEEDCPPPEGCDDGWSLETVAAAAAGTPDVAVDERGGVHVAYVSADGAELRYAHRRAAAREFTEETADGKGGKGGFHALAIALDREAGVHLAYGRHTGWQLVYAARGRKGEWASRVLVEAGGLRNTPLSYDARPDLLVGDDGRVHLALLDAGTFDLSYFNFAPDGPAGPVQLGRRRDLYGPASLALDPGGGLHALAEGLHAFSASDEGVGWEANVLPEGDVLAADPREGAHVAFAGGPGYARGRPKDGAWAWEPERLAAGGCEQPALAVDGSGVPHIVCAGKDGLRHLYRADGAWRSEPLAAGRPAAFPAIAAGVCGELHVVFLAGEAAAALRYARSCPRRWRDAGAGEAVAASPSWVKDTCESPDAAVACGGSDCGCPEICCGERAEAECVYPAACDDYQRVACDGAEDCSGTCCVWASGAPPAWEVRADCRDTCSHQALRQKGEFLDNPVDDYWEYNSRACHRSSDCAGVTGSTVDFEDVPFTSCCTPPGAVVSMCLRPSDC